MSGSFVFARRSRRSPVSGLRIAGAALCALAASAIGAIAADGGRLGGPRAPHVLIASLTAKPHVGGRFNASALHVPGTHHGADAWYHHLAHYDIRPERVASLETRAEAGTRLAQESQKPVQLIETTGETAVASLSDSSSGVADSTSRVVATQVLAYADSSPKAEGGALAAIETIARVPGVDPAEQGLGAMLTEDVILPIARPKFEPVPLRKEPKAADVREAAPDVEKPKAVAVARPEKPVTVEKPEKGGFLKNLFGSTPRAGGKVAVYDISAGKVYMPDGSVLDAASGIGKMANNPKYAHVKMNGPTPPHTYNLRMRETRFHGVEAIRMLPVDGRNKFGRDGFLAHTQLLRGRPGQSHGCVAFEEYEKFLRAFKQGKVKQMVVVPGGGRAVFARVSRGGDDA
ncbi:MAG: DUF2778 domain-containing protein [Mesorhizobium sp.]